MGRVKGFFAYFLAFMLLCITRPGNAAVFTPDVRVLISVGKQRELSFTPVGTFVFENDKSITIKEEELIIKAVGGRVSLDVGGKTITAPSITFLSGNYGNKSDYIRLRNAEYGVCTYLGNITFDVSGTYIRAINTLPLDQYLYGVVPHEMSNLFPTEALKAQAVCARGYAIARSFRYQSRAYDLVDTSSDQVYRGYASRNNRAIAAVEATAGKVLTYDGDIIEAFYSASNGGQTEKSGNVWENNFPYYINSDDPYDTINPSSIEEKSFIPQEYNEKTISFMDRNVYKTLCLEACKKANRAVDLVSTVDVTPKDPIYDEPSRSYTNADVTLMVSYDENGQEKLGQVTITLVLEDMKYGSFENTLGRIGATKTRLRLRGAEKGVYYSNGQEYNGWYLTERRYGHGIGLSQRGAQQRARAGQSYTDILSFYYVNTILNTIGTYETAPEITSTSYRVRKWGVSGISAGTSGEDMLKRLSSKGELSIITSKGTVATGAVGTGCFVRVIYDEGKAYFDLPIVIYGDLDGNGKSDENDIQALQSHLLRNPPLTGARLLAADVNNSGIVNTDDLLLLIRHVNGDSKISQGG